MAKLDAEKRARLPSQAFALPGRRFPINDAEHARLALAMVGRSQHAGNLSAAEAAKVRSRARAKLHHPRFGSRG